MALSMPPSGPMPTPTPTPIPTTQGLDNPGLQQVNDQLGQEGLEFLQGEAAKRATDPNAWGQDTKMDDILNKLANNESLSQDELDHIKMKMEESKGSTSGNSPDNSVPNSPTPSPSDNKVGGGCPYS